MTEGALIVIRALAIVSEMFDSLSRALRSEPHVTEVLQRCWISRQGTGFAGSVLLGQGDGAGVDWYADAELVDGRAISFSLEAGWRDAEWVVHPNVCVTSVHGQDRIIELADRFAVEDAEFARELVGAAEAVINARDDAFLEALNPESQQKGTPG